MSGVSGIVLHLLLVLLCAAPIATVRTDSVLEQTSIADVVALVQTSVVRIVVAHPPSKPGDNSSNQSNAAESEPVSKIGSGLVTVSSSLMATNRQFVENSVSIFVGTEDGARYRAQIINTAVESDIALLRIEAGLHLPALTFGDSDSLRPGDMVIPIGSPFEFDNTVTAGIVSSVNRDSMESSFDDYI